MTAPEDEVVGLVSALIRFDTSNTGELETTNGEAECAQWVAGQLREAGFEPEYLESGAPGRGNVFARLPGADPGRVRSGASTAGPSPRSRSGTADAGYRLCAAT